MAGAALFAQELGRMKTSSWSLISEFEFNVIPQLLRPLQHNAWTLNSRAAAPLSVAFMLVLTC